MNAHRADPGALALRRLGGLAALLVLVVASFASLDLKVDAFLGAESWLRMRDFARELVHPELSGGFLRKTLVAALETLSMSTLGTLIAALLALAIAFGASAARPLLNVLRAIPELVWASLLLISAGLGPFAGTLALALHTTGVLGRLYLEAFENQPGEAAFVLSAAGASRLQVFWYARFPQALPQLISYTIYRWENNIRAAAVLGVVGAGGLGQMLALHLQLFQMGRASTVIGATLLLVALVDALSDRLRRALG